MFRNHADISRSAVNHDVGPSRTYECDFCDAGWQSETDTFFHRENHAEEMKKWFKRRKHNVCLTCVKNFSGHWALMKHYKVRHLYSAATAKRIERQIYVCDKCSQVFFNKNMLTAHIFKKHWVVGENKSSKMMLNCPNCNQEVMLSKLWQHLQKHTALTVSLCKVCYTKCKDSENLQHHLSTNHNSYYYCNQCSTAEINLNKFQEHIELHENEIRKLEIDWKTKKPKTKLIRNWKYPKLKLFDGLELQGQIQVCILCRHICKDNLEMKNHAASHFVSLQPKKIPLPPKQSNKYVCLCGESFTSNIVRKQHLLKYKEGHGPTEIKEEETQNIPAVETEEITGSNSNKISKKIEEMVTDELLDRMFINR